ncbi:MAG: UDP-N-acetylmuramate--L-alanine ligase, partial [Saprospiraceae bacterium]|nr:UDP-N-acetylmuramate--L-alanine ligase [Saprospiraceae bacterium]
EIIIKDKIVYIDDYAHHPGELNAAIQAARELYPEAYILGIFQPHLFTRTRDFAEGFAKELDKLDEVWLMDIYPAREIPIAGVTSQMLIELMNNPKRKILSRDEILQEMKNVRTGVIMTLGAGDIDTLVKPISELLKNNIR